MTGVLVQGKDTEIHRKGHMKTEAENGNYAATSQGISGVTKKWKRQRIPRYFRRNVAL